jgi:hypothetical protein
VSLIVYIFNSLILVVEGDVLLSVANDELMFDNHELNDILTHFPVEETQAEDHNAADLDDSDNLMSVFPSKTLKSNI